MGNQEVKKAMAGIQSKDYPVSTLYKYEEVLWSAYSFSNIRDFIEQLNVNEAEWNQMHTVSSILAIEKSGLDSDDKRFEQQALELRQAGYSTTEKKLESLK